MRLIRRLLLFITEVAVLLFGLAISLALAIYFASGENSDAAATPILLAGSCLTILGLFMFRRKTRGWKIEYDAAGWARTQAERRTRPIYARYKRIVQRTLLCVPSAVAAFVLFFLPVVSHMTHPRSRYLKHYRVPIPWTMLVLSQLGSLQEYSFVRAYTGASSDPGRFGFMPFWEPAQLYSLMVFGSVPPGATTFEFNHKQRVAGRGEPSREFRFGDAALTCWQNFNTRRPHWEVACDTPPEVHEQNFYAMFYGREEDIPVFYRIIEGVTPVK